VAIRFDQLIRPSMVIRDVKVQYPQTVEVFENLRFRDSCDDCSIEVVARKHGLDSYLIIDALNEAAFGVK